VHRTHNQAAGKLETGYVWFDLVWFALLCFALLWFALLCFALVCFTLLYFALLYFALLCFALVSDAFLQAVPPGAGAREVSFLETSKPTLRPIHPLLMDTGAGARS
jgi:dolichyl-phosphate-mannose--protein O-mannosyl transferase